MSIKRTPAQLALLASMMPTDRQWRKWRELRYVRYWCAALLTMQVQPTAANRAALREQCPEDYECYQDRLDVLLRRRLKRKSLQAVGETSPSTKASNERVDLHAVARFAVEIDWDSDKKVVERIFLVSPTSDVDPEIDNLTIGQRNTFVRYTAFVKLLRMALDKPAELAELCEKVAQREKGKPKQKRSTISNEKLGALVGEMVRCMSGAKTSPPYGFRQGVNADEIAKAQRITDARVW